MVSSIRYLPSSEWYVDWQRCQAYIEDALQHNFTNDNIYDVMSVLDRGAGWLWPGLYGAGVTFMQGDDYIIWLYGGEMTSAKQIKDAGRMLKSMVWHATRLNASKVVVYGRKGWARKLLPDYGFKTAHVIMEKPLR